MAGTTNVPIRPTAAALLCFTVAAVRMRAARAAVPVGGCGSAFVVRRLGESYDA